jgi:alkylation response protein AidB-like acyl-CoA dehydrogenase
MDPVAIVDPVHGMDPDDVTLVRLVREVAAKEVRPSAAVWEREHRFPREAFGALGRAGLLGLPYPEALGGGGLPTPLYLLAIEELAAAMLAVGLGVSVQVLTMFPTVRFGTPAQQRDWLPPALSGEWIGSYCLSEPGSGSDAAAMRTRAERRDGGYVLSGTKAWVTHGSEAAYAIVFCRTDEGSRGVSCLFVPLDTAGVACAKVEDKMGMNASPTAQLIFDDVSVPEGQLLGAEGDGFPIAMAALDGGRLGIGSCAVGLAREALSVAVRYAKERRQFGKPIIEQQGLAFLLADMATGVATSRALIGDAARHRDAGSTTAPAQAAMAKLHATDTAMRVTTDAVQVLGGYGYVEEFPVERFMREAKVLQIVEGTNQIQRVVISRALARDAT